MDQIRYIIAGRFIDGSGTAVRRGALLTVQNSVITAIEFPADLHDEKRVFTDDFSHCTILPALVDCSVSLSQSPSVDNSVRLSNEEADISKKRITLKRHINYCHAHGVLGVADSDETDTLRKYSENDHKEKEIPAIQTSGRLCRSLEDFTTVSSQGVDFIKIAYSANIEDNDTHSSQLSQQELSHILEHKGDKKAVVIANGPQQVAEAINAGCDAIEQGYGMGEENLQNMASKNVLWIPNAVRAKNSLDGASGGGDVCCRFSTRYVAPGKPIPGAKEFWQKVLTEQLTQLRLAKKLGVTTAVGTGAGNIGILHGESMSEEIKLFIKAGFSLEEAIQCASQNGARFFGMDQLGALTVGQQATFLVTRGTTKQLPRKLSYLENIYIGGVPSPAYSKHPFMH